MPFPEKEEDLDLYCSIPEMKQASIGAFWIFSLPELAAIRESNEKIIALSESLPSIPEENEDMENAWTKTHPIYKQRIA